MYSSLVDQEAPLRCLDDCCCRFCYTVVSIDFHQLDCEDRMLWSPIRECTFTCMHASSQLNSACRVARISTSSTALCVMSHDSRPAHCCPLLLKHVLGSNVLESRRSLQIGGIWVWPSSKRWRLRGRRKRQMHCQEHPVHSSQRTSCLLRQSCSKRASQLDPQSSGHAGAQQMAARTCVRKCGVSCHLRISGRVARARPGRGPREW